MLRRLLVLPISACLLVLTPTVATAQEETAEAAWVPHVQAEARAAIAGVPERFQAETAEEAMAAWWTRLDAFLAGAWYGQVAANEQAAREAQAARAARRAPQSRPSGSPSGSWWDQLAACETGGNWQDGGDYGGGLGIWIGAWEDYGGLEYAPRPQDATREQQIAVGENIGRDGFGGWGCVSNGTVPRP